MVTMHPDDPVSTEKTSLKDTSNVEDGEESEEKKLTYRQRLAAFLQCNAVQYTVIAFVVIDGIIVILELLIDLEIIKFPDSNGDHESVNSTHGDSAHNISLDESTYAPLMVMPDPHHENGGHHHVKHHGRHHHGEHSIVTQTIATVTHYLLNSTNDEYGGNFSLHGDHHDDHHDDHHGAHHHSNKEVAEHILHLCSLIILCLFLVEVICKIIAEGTHLLKHKAEVLDAFVVIISFTLDVVFSFVDVAQAAKDAAGLMVMLRLWRVTRLINGVIISVQMEADKKVHKIEVVLHAAERENEQLRDKIKLLQEELETLKSKMNHTEDKLTDSSSESTSHSALQNASQKTDEDIIDILMGWDSPQFLNTQSAHTPLTPSPATTTTTSTVSTSVIPAKDRKSSSTSQSSKSMFMVFDDKTGQAPLENGQNVNVIGPKPPVFVVPVDEGSPKHTATNAAYEEENHPHQILHFPHPPDRKNSSKDDKHPNLSSIQPYISPNYPVPELEPKKKVITSPTQPMAPKHIPGDQPKPTPSRKHSGIGQYSPPSSSVDIPRKPSFPSPVDAKVNENLRHFTKSDPQLTFPATSTQSGSNTPPTNGNDSVVPLIPPPAGKRSAENRKKSVPSSHPSGHPALNSSPKLEKKVNSSPKSEAKVNSYPTTENGVNSSVDVEPSDGKGSQKLTSVQSIDHNDEPPKKESTLPPAAIILPPVSSVDARKKSINGSHSEYVPLKSPRQQSPPLSENVFFDIDNKSSNSSFLGDAMSDSPAEKDPGAPR